MSNGGGTRGTFEPSIGTGFRIDREEEEPGPVRLIASGELDLATSGLLDQEIASLDGSRGPVVLDLRDVTFMDSTGLRALWTARQHLATVDRQLILSAPSDAVMRVLQLTKLNKVFDYEDPIGATGTAPIDSA